MFEKMSSMEVGTLVTFCGIAIVFMVLIILVLAISMFGKMMTSKNGKKENPVADIKQVKNAGPSVAHNDTAEDEIIAVIAAAVDAIYEGTGKRAVVRSIRPASGNMRSAWATAGLMQNVRSF